MQTEKKPLTPLKQYLKRAHISLKEFAEIVDCHPVYLSSLSKDQRHCSARLAKDVFAATKGEVRLRCKEKKPVNPVEESCQIQN